MKLSLRDQDFKDLAEAGLRPHRSTLGIGDRYINTKCPSGRAFSTWRNVNPVSPPYLSLTNTIVSLHIMVVGHILTGRVENRRTDANFVYFSALVSVSRLRRSAVMKDLPIAVT